MEGLAGEGATEAHKLNDRNPRPASSQLAGRAYLRWTTVDHGQYGGLSLVARLIQETPRRPPINLVALKLPVSG